MTDELKARLIGLGLNDEQIGKLTDEGVKDEAGMTLLSAEEIKAATGCGLVTAKQVAAAFKPVADIPASHFATSSFDVLPPVPADDAWLASLKVGGILKVNKDLIIGAVSAALAGQMGLYELPKKLAEAMKRQAQSLRQPVSQEYYALDRMLVERRYADLFANMPDGANRFATISEKKDLLSKLGQHIWPALIGFQGELASYMASWNTNPAMMMTILASASSGVPLPPGMMGPPPTDQLRDAVEGVVTSINEVFAGTGIPTAMALAYDAQQIRKTLDEEALPVLVGAANRDQMLQQLGVAVSSDYPRLELNLKRFTLGVIDLPNQTPGQAEIAYIDALHRLGLAIPWNKLEGGTAGIGGIGGRGNDQL